MATPAANSGSNGSASTGTVAPIPQDPDYLINLGRDIYIKGNEYDLFEKWLVLPHPDIHIASYLEIQTTELPTFTPALETKVAATISLEQERRFKRVAESRDIQLTQWKLGLLKKEVEDSLGVLQAEEMDAIGEL